MFFLERKLKRYNLGVQTDESIYFSIAGILRTLTLIHFFLVYGFFIIIPLAIVLIACGVAIALYQKSQVLRRRNSVLEGLLNQKIEQLQGEKIKLKQALKDACENYRKIEAHNSTLHNINHYKDEFLRQISHELRTPMNGIIGSLQLLLDDLYDSQEEKMELLQQAYQSSVHSLTLINRVLDLAKIESGYVMCDLRSVDLHACLSAAAYLQLANIRQKGLQFNLEHDPNLIQVIADPTYLKQVFINIIGNAVKFTEQGGITIQTTIPAAIDLNGGTFPKAAVITVRDTGIGIEPQAQNKLFQPFQVENERVVHPQGSTGLGLTISKQLIEMMGGQIRLLSLGRDQGTTVEIVLPLAMTTSQAAEESELSAS
ncbi:MAG: sensor histidine kinase [Microcoleaceae cyanobacterium]